MLCLGIESTAHTFSCSVVNSENRIGTKSDDIVLSEVRDIYKAPAGSGDTSKGCVKTPCTSGAQVPKRVPCYCKYQHE